MERFVFFAVFAVFATSEQQGNAIELIISLSRMRVKKNFLFYLFECIRTFFVFIIGSMLFCLIELFTIVFFLCFYLPNNKSYRKRASQNKSPRCIEYCKLSRKSMVLLKCGPPSLLSTNCFIPCLSMRKINLFES